MELEEMRLYFKMPSSAFRRKKFFVDPSSLLPSEGVRVFFIIFFFFQKVSAKWHYWISTNAKLENKFIKSNYQIVYEGSSITCNSILYYRLLLARSTTSSRDRRKRKKEMVETSSDKKLVCKDVNETVCFLREAKLRSISNEPWSTIKTSKWFLWNTSPHFNIDTDLLNCAGWNAFSTCLNHSRE